MGLVYQPTSSGLVLALQGQDEAAVAAALKQHDDSLRLVPQDSDHFGTRIYKVYKYMGPDRPSVFLMGWWDELGNPFPLSMALIDKIKLLDKNTVGAPGDPDVMNKQLIAERRKDYNRDAEAIVKEFGRKLDGQKSVPLPRSQGLRLARDRVRRTQTNHELRP